MNQKPTPPTSSMEPARTVLVTGFEPFGTHATNISQRVVERLEHELTLVSPWDERSIVVHVETNVLTVDEVGARATAKQIEKGHRWDAILHLGLCESCDVPRIERLAQDQLDMRIPDNQGRQVHQTQLDGQGHRGCWLDLTLWDAERFPVPFVVSSDAGTYLCNETYHCTMKAACELPLTDPVPPPVLFLHLPGESISSVEQGVEMVKACLAYMVDPYPVHPQHVVAAALSTTEGQVLVTQRAASEADANLWEFPGGKCESDEPWSVALERELQEELQVDVRARHPLGSWYRKVGNAAFVIHLIHAPLVGVPPAMSMSVHQAMRWVNPNTSPKLAWAGRDGEMLSYLQTVFTPTSSTRRPSPSSDRR